MKLFYRKDKCLRFLILNGPNLNMLGIREPSVYGKKDYRALVAFLKSVCKEEGVKPEIIQSNYEGRLVYEIQRAYRRIDGIIINAGAYTHTSIAIHDALKAVSIPTAEVHLSDITKREDFRKVSYIAPASTIRCMGKGFESYKDAVIGLKQYITAPTEEKIAKEEV